MGDAPADYYEMLGVDRHASATEIKAAYRQLAMRFHPDRNPGDRAAEDRFKELSEAYAVLSEPEKREHYDRFGRIEGTSPFAGAVDVRGATEFFDTVLGDLFGWDRKRAAGEDLRYTLELDFAEAALGCEKEIRFRRAESCGDCAGTGANGGAIGLMPCTRCEGKGHFRTGTGLFSARRECRACGGSGEVPREKCRNCLGSGLVDRERVYTVRVPPASVKGSAQRIAGEGSPGRRGGANGDLHVLVRVKSHACYREEGGVVVVEVPVALEEMALGAEVEVPALDGTVRMKIPAGTQAGATFRLRGKGMPSITGARGDLHVRVQIETPVELPDGARELLRQFAQAAGDAAYPRRAEFRRNWRTRGDDDKQSG